MSTRAQKISLLSELIAFALVDEELHDKEYDFLLMVSIELGIEKDAFLDLFRKRDDIIPIKDEFQRIVQFYRLALLMHCDGKVDFKENQAIHHIGLRMGLNPKSMDYILKIMQSSENHLVEAEELVSAFQIQHN
ncbi:excinuclease ABC subunit B [Flavobacterium branchiophilum]|uniref:Excinuclease ABC subunit B n=1 Tax=Flavobacterium branchiophilum TaxID=55197 RepID=A0A2H3KY50_9FLAO|nr:excinuclease ABC subunit B [Flavobacterium branchiophilum]PDS26287.1 excinuclease ABC subunit B [Flavobacterium branchiophilum]